ILLSDRGKIKRLAGTEFAELTNRGATLMKLKEGDCLRYWSWTREGEDVAIATSGGRVLRFAVDDVQLPLMGRSAQGNQATRLRTGEAAVGCTSFHLKNQLLVVSQFGYVKRIAPSEIRRAHRGDIGTQVLQFSHKRDRLVGMVLVPPEDKAVTLVTSTDRAIALPVKSVRLWKKDGLGDRIPKLKANEQIVELISPWH
ncbi:MAG: DNA gyrase C-terminal beta-propeller domain-containing protein, partial [Cyanobacteriota bacterium]|nr:DNA gyrase C-terminal beta-propeller domain-containing protein [Cyanobacteriota bacterium]